MKRFSKTTLVAFIALVSVVATVGVAGAATYGKAGQMVHDPGFFAKGGFNQVAFKGSQKFGAFFRGPKGFVDMNIVAQDLGMQPSELAAELKAGKSINDVAAAKGVDTAKLTQDLQTAAEAKIDQAVQAGKLTADQASTIKAKLAQQIQTFLTNAGKGRDIGPGFKGPKGFLGPKSFMEMNTVAQELGMQPADLMAELKAGKSINDVATAKGVDTAKLAQDLQTAAEAKIDQTVQAGKLPAEKASTIKANLAQQIQTFLNRKSPESAKNIGEDRQNGLHARGPQSFGHKGMAPGTRNTSASNTNLL